MRLSDVQHQPRALSLLRRSLAAGRVPHALLFEGPEGVGKECAAQALAARLLCEAPSDGDACGACRSCRLMASGNHPDYHLIHRGLHKQHPDKSIRAGKGLFLAVDVVRHFLIEPASSAPSLGRRRVFVVRDAERMNEGAQNALLKTLEEPPGAACLILVTSSAQRLLPTIRSRCQPIGFDPLPDAFVRQQLTQRTGLDDREASALAGLAQGRLGAALRWHAIGLLGALESLARLLAEGGYNHPEAFAKALIEQATALAQAGGEPDEGEPEPARARAARTIETDQLRDALKLVLMLVAAVLRDALRVNAGGQVALALPAASAAARRLAQGAATDIALRIDAIATAEQMLDRNVAPPLACERLAIALMGETAIA